MSFSRVRCKGFLERRDAENLLPARVPLGRLALGSAKLPKWRRWEGYQSLRDCRKFLIKYSGVLSMLFTTNQSCVYHKFVLYSASRSQETLYTLLTLKCTGKSCQRYLSYSLPSYY